ncbi:MAG: hypothetical protein ACLR7D_16780 [Lachnospira eligens]
MNKKGCYGIIFFKQCKMGGLSKYRHRKGFAINGAVNAYPDLVVKTESEAS